MRRYTGDKATSYTYGSTLSDSDIARNDLLVNVAYPDSTGSSDTVTTTYNRLGQKKTVTDQRGVVHTYEYDKLGRQTEDKVTNLGSSGIVDNYVLRIQQAYDVRGLLYQLTSHSATSGGSVRNQCEYHYNGFGQFEEEFQEHGGAVQSGTPSVQYQYESGDDGSGHQTNTIRQTGITYPDGRQIDYGYTATAVTDGMSQVSDITDTTNSVKLAEYTFLGSGLAVRVAYPEPKVWLDLWGGSGATFTGLDAFNRVTDQKWQNNTDTTPVTIDRYTYTYDAMGNRLTRGNPLHNAFDEAYGYDSLNRLVSMERGSSGATRAEAWTLDETGNWLSYDTSTGVTPDLSQTRSANEVNEITDISSTPTWADPAYDAAGNMTAFVKLSSPSSNLTATYDAWNRLVKVADGSSTLVEYRYDGKRRRVVRLGYTGGTLSETRHFCFASKWREIEDRLGGSSSATRQVVWGVRFVDDFIAQDDAISGRHYATNDGNRNVTAAVATNGDVAERRVYAPYGSEEVLDSNWTAASSGSIAALGFQSLVHDQPPGLIFARIRMLNLTVGVWSTRIGAGAPSSGYEFEISAPMNYADPIGLDFIPIGPSLPIDSVPAITLPIQLPERTSSPQLPITVVPGQPRVPSLELPIEFPDLIGPSMPRIDPSTLQPGTPSALPDLFPTDLLPSNPKICCWHYAPGLIHCEIVLHGDCYSAAGTNEMIRWHLLRRNRHGVLSYGPGVGKSCASASWYEIQRCVTSCESANPYSFPTTPMWNCQRQAALCASACCMNSDFYPQWIAFPEGPVIPLLPWIIRLPAGPII